ncbi:MAG: MBL fold metallo-hydrolase [Candidatus Paceibacterota bacterium]
MKLTFYGGAESVTGAQYMLESEGKKILIECGMTQGEDYCEKKNFEPLSYNPKEIEAVIITHAHIDHIGMLPRLFKEGFQGEIYSTEPTKDFSELLLLDSADILRKEAEKHGKKPLYEEEDINALMKKWRKMEYYQPFQVGVYKIEFKNAGHILGSASAIIEAENKKIVFSGDLGNSEPSIIKEKDYIKEADYALIESVYGARIHEDADKRRDMLEDFVEEVINDKGTLLIPTFAMERTQELLFELDSLIRKGRIPKVPIYLDSPLAIKLTTIYKKYRSYFREEIADQIKLGDDIFDFPGLDATLTHEESLKIDQDKGPKIIMAGSGMSQGGRILRHELNYLSDSKSGILFAGYQAEGSLGRQIQEGKNKVVIFGKEVEVKCKIKNIDGYSAHADQRELINWAGKMAQSVKIIFVTQGDKEAAETLATKIRDELAIETKVPKPKEEVVI